jgi:hypothetical protein
MVVYILKELKPVRGNIHGKPKHGQKTIPDVQ